ncbi:glycine/D-amino acid oxidase, partial [mine drainage metagenome]
MGIGAAHGFVQRGDLIVELIAALVEAPPRSACHFLRALERDPRLRRRARFGQTRGELQHVERAPAIAVGGARDQLQRGRLRLQPERAEPPLAIGERRAQQAHQSRLLERLQHIHPRPRQQRAHHFERRILRRGADEGERTVLQIRQERVLLRLVESVHLIEKQDRRPPIVIALGARRLDRGAYVLHARHHGRERDELRLAAPGDQSGQGGLAGAGRAPQNHRVQPAGLDCLTQRLA